MGGASVRVQFVEAVSGGCHDVVGRVEKAFVSASRCSHGGGGGRGHDVAPALLPKVLAAAVVTVTRVLVSPCCRFRSVAG